MTKLTTKSRKAIPTKEFALPSERKYPIENVSHARNAKARASMEYNKGNLSAGQKATIDRKANRKLGIKEHEAEHWGD
jgi:hypothetical protein